MRTPKAMAQLRALTTSAQADAAMLHDRLNRGTDLVCEAMEAIHGGNWVINVDHEYCFVMIIERPRKGGAR